MSSGVTWTYDEDSQIFTLLAKKGVAIKYSANWIGEQHTIYGFAAGFSL